jgi:hypothetical protein
VTVGDAIKSDDIQVKLGDKAALKEGVRVFEKVVNFVE